jgi:hypothetical protein
MFFLSWQGAGFSALCGSRKMFEGFANHQAAAETVRGVLEKYLSNERPFAASIDKKSLGA